MPAPRIVEAFIPYQIVKRALDKGRSPYERILYGLTTLAMIAMLTAGIIKAQGGNIEIAEILHQGVVWFFALVQLSFTFIVAAEYLPKGIRLYPTHHLKGIGYCVVGGFLGLLGVILAGTMIFIVTTY